MKRTTYTNSWSKTWILILHDFKVVIHEFVCNVLREVSISSLITTQLCILQNKACSFSSIFATTVVEMTIFHLQQGKNPSNFIRLAWNNFLNTNTATITGKYKTLFLECNDHIEKKFHTYMFIDKLQLYYMSIYKTNNKIISSKFEYILIWLITNLNAKYNN